MQELTVERLSTNMATTLLSSCMVLGLQLGIGGRFMLLLLIILLLLLGGGGGYYGHRRWGYGGGAGVGLGTIILLILIIYMIGMVPVR